MTILQFGVFPPPEGGVQSHVKDLRDYLRRERIRCGVVHLTRYRQADRDDVFYPRTPIDVMRIALAFPADIFHFHLGGNITKELLGLYGFGTSIPRRRTVLTFHSGGYPDSAAAQKPNLIRNRVFRRFDRLIGVNSQIITMFQSWGMPHSKLRMISPFATPTVTPVRLPDTIREFVAGHSPLLMSINGLEPEYDVPIQIDVMEKILKRHPKAGLIIAGHGRLEGELKTYISTKPWSSSVLLCGDLPRPVTLNLLAGADLMLRTTWYDGDAISVREALHYSVRVVASDNGMRPNGVVLFPARDPGSLEHAILDTLKQPKLPHTPPPAVEDNLKAVLEVYHELGGQRAEQVNNCCTDKIA